MFLVLKINGMTAFFVTYLCNDPRKGMVSVVLGAPVRLILRHHHSDRVVRDGDDVIHAEYSSQGLRRLPGPTAGQVHLLQAARSCPLPQDPLATRTSPQSSQYPDFPYRNTAVRAWIEVSSVCRA